jgi:hypothetical protein
MIAQGGPDVGGYGAISRIDWTTSEPPHIVAAYASWLLREDAIRATIISHASFARRHQ